MSVGGEATPGTLTGERMAQDLSRSVAIMMEHHPRPRGARATYPVPSKWWPKIDTDIVIVKEDRRSWSGYDFYKMGPPSAVQNQLMRGGSGRELGERAAAGGG